MRALVEVTVNLVSTNSWRNGVVTAFAQRVAATDTLQCEPASAPCAVGVDRFQRVVGTGRVIPAGRSVPRAYDELVRPDQDAEDGAHVVATFCQSPVRLCWIRMFGASRAAARAPMMMSAAGNAC